MILILSGRLPYFLMPRKKQVGLVPGDDEESVMRRNQLQSALIRELIERSGLNKQNGQSKTNTEMFAAAEAAS